MAGVEGSRASSGASSSFSSVSHASAGGAGGDAAAVCGEGGKDETPDGAGEGGVGMEDALVDEGGKGHQEPAARACRRGSSGVYAAGAGEGGMALSAQPLAGRVSSGLQGLAALISCGGAPCFPVADGKAKPPRAYLWRRAGTSALKGARRSQACSSVAPPPR